MRLIPVCVTAFSLSSSAFAGGGVVMVVDADATTAARAALADAGVVYAETAVVIRGYAVFDAPGGADFNSVEYVGLEVALWNQPMKLYQDPAGSAIPPTQAIIDQFPTAEFDTFVTLGALTADDLSGVWASLTETESRIVGELLDLESNPSIGPADTPLGNGQWGALVFQLTVLGACSDEFPTSGSVDPNPFLLGSLDVVGYDVSGAGSFGPLSPPCLGELQADETFAVSGADLAALLTAWGPANPCGVRADFTLDSVVDGADLAVLLTNWGCQP